MITLFTGVPGSGKTVYAVSTMLDAIKQGRPLFVHGIPNLKLPHTRIFCNSPICEVCPPEPLIPNSPSTPDFNSHESIEEQYKIDNENYQNDMIVYNQKKELYEKNLKAEDWQEWAPTGSLIFIDEVQYVYPARSSSSKAPMGVAVMPTHRHKGIDFFFVSQAPLFLDTVIRRLVNKHIHLRPTWAGRYQYEFPECKDSTANLQSGVKSKYKLNQKVFDLFKSSSLHTVVPKKIPKSLYVIFFVIIMFIALAFNIKSRLHARTVSSVEIESNDNLDFQTLDDSNNFSLNQTTDLVIEVKEMQKFDLIQLSSMSFIGVDISEYKRLPANCLSFSDKSFKCPIPFAQSSNFKSSVCTPEYCYSLIPINY